MSSAKHVLLIDDDEDDGFIFETALSQVGNSIGFTFSQDGLVAINNFKEGKLQSPDILFLDWNMPKFSGRDFLLEIRNIPAYRSLPIIIFSTSTSPYDKKEAEKLGASFFLTKPDSIPDLATQLKELLEAKWTTNIG